MFGKLPHPNYVTRPKRRTKNPDIKLPGIIPGNYAHNASNFRTNNEARLMLHRQQLHSNRTRHIDKLLQELTEEKIIGRYNKHAKKAILTRTIKERFQEKVEAYERDIERRRLELRKLFCADEEEYVLETIALAHEEKELVTEARKKRAENSKKTREAERLELVDQKRMEQFKSECEEFRITLIKRNAMDVEAVQLAQIKENEMQRELERELHNLYDTIRIKKQEVENEEEVQQTLKKKQFQKETQEVLDKQIRGKELLKREVEMMATEDALEMAKLAEQLKLEKIEATNAEKRKRDKYVKELNEHLAIREKCKAERRKEEETYQKAMAESARKELDLELKKAHDVVINTKQNWVGYQQYVNKVEEKKKREDEDLNRLLIEERKKTAMKEDEAYCKIAKARKELQKNVLAELDKQCEYKKQEAENRLKMKEVEAELSRRAWKAKKALEAEDKRQQAEKCKAFGKELKKQKDESMENKKLEKQQLEREFAENLAEEGRRQQMFAKALSTETMRPKHPNRVVLEKQECPCEDTPAANHRTTPFNTTKEPVKNYLQ